MNKENREINLNQLINKSNNLIKDEQLFCDNTNCVFTDTRNNDVRTEMINVNTVDNIHKQDDISLKTVEITSDLKMVDSPSVIDSNKNNDILSEVINNVSITDVTKPIDNIEVEISDSDLSKNKKNNLLKFFTNRKVFLWIVILIFVFTSITVGKLFYLRSIVDEYEDFFIEIEDKLSEDTIVYLDEESMDDSLKDVAASELVSCINSSVDVNNLPESITSIINEINNYYNQSYNHFAFKYKDLYTGFTISYNENQNIFTASTIKAPKDIYIYEMASLGKINLDDKLTYTSNYANTGAWELKYKSFNTSYDIRTLVRYSTVSSDNAAHNMLMDHFGRNNMLAFWQELGTTAIFTDNNNWGITNAHDAAIYMEELYRFYLEDEVYGAELMNNFLNATPKFIKGKNDYKVANKSGWAGTAVHDVSIIFADNPYIVVALSNLGQIDYYMSYFNKANDLAYRLHTEYWKYKMEICGNINQY